IGDGTGSSGFTNGTNGDQVGTAAMPIDPKLGALQDNGGPTRTMALRTGSPALDTGDPHTFPATDQRGVTRPQDGTGTGTALPDIGAYEVKPPTITGLSPTSSLEGGAGFTLTVTGTLFTADATVRWNNSPLATTFVSSTQLQATVPTSLLAEEGAAGI